MKIRFDAARAGFALAAAVIGIGFVAIGGAVAAPFTNGSFENGTFVPDGNQTDVLGAGSTAMTGWTVTVHDIAWINGNQFGLAPSDGSKFLDLTSYGSGAGAGVEQTFDTVKNGSYTVTFDLGGGNGVSIAASAGSSSQTFTGASLSGATSWEQQSLSFVANGPSTLLSLVGTNSVGNYIGLDHVQLTFNGVVATTPLPGSVLMFGTALLGLGLTGWRRGAGGAPAV